MRNGTALRRCRCGQYILMSDLMEFATADSSELPRIDEVPEEQLPECIKTLTDVPLEIAARLWFWRVLNHPYRQKYREHREAEEAATKAAWLTANTERKAGVSTHSARKVPARVKIVVARLTPPTAVYRSRRQLLFLARDSM